MQRLRGLCIGAGYFAKFHFDAWRRMDDVEIVGICDTDLAKARRAAAQFPAARAFHDADTALSELAPDFVDIITRPAAHLSLIDRAAVPGRAIICQKPLADDLAEAERIVDLALRRGARLMVHENFRFQPWYREIKRLLDRGTIGRRLHGLTICSRLGDGWGESAYLDRQPYFRRMPRLLIHETGVHFLDTFRFLAGDIARVSAVARRWNPGIVGEDTAVMTVQFENDAIGIWNATRYHESTAVDPRYTFGTLVVEAEEGRIRLDDEGRLWVKRLGEPEYEHVYVHQRVGFAGDCVFFTQRHFIECLRSGAAFETSGREYLKTLAVVEAAYRSAANHGQVVSVSSNPTATPSPESTFCELGYRYVDLSLPVESGQRGVDITPCTTIAAHGWNASTLSLYSHAGTHMDAPKHFLGDEGFTIDRLPLAVCWGPARIVDLTPIAAREEITVTRFLSRAAEVCRGERLLLRTDWSKRFGTPEYREALPRISLELAAWLVQHEVALIGVEAPSVADVNNLRELTDVHQVLFRGNVIIVEGLANLDQLTRGVVEFCALPLRVTGGDGCPVRAVAREVVANMGSP